MSTADNLAAGGHWTFLSNHLHVLFCLSEEPDVRLRDVAERVGITERAVQRIVSELEFAGIITREKEGRRNHYEIHGEVALRHPLEAHHTVGELIALLSGPRRTRGASRRDESRG